MFIVKALSPVIALSESWDAEAVVPGKIESVGEVTICVETRAAARTRRSSHTPVRWQGWRASTSLSRGLLS